MAKDWKPFSCPMASIAQMNDDIERAEHLQECHYWAAQRIQALTEENRLLREKINAISYKYDLNY